MDDRTRQTTQGSRARLVSVGVGAGAALALFALVVVASVVVAPSPPTRLGMLPQPPIGATVWLTPLDRTMPAPPHPHVRRRLEAADSQRLHVAPTTSAIVPAASRRAQGVRATAACADPTDRLLAYATRSSRTRGQPS